MRLSIHALLVDTCVGNDKIRPGLTGKKPLSTNFLGYISPAEMERRAA